MEKLTLKSIIEARDLNQKFLDGDKDFGRKIDVSFFHNKHLKDIIFPAMGDLSCHFAQESLFENIIFSEIDFYGTNFNRSKFKNCIFCNCNFVKSEMQNVGFTDCIFNNCKMFRSLLSGEISRCVFNGCDLQKMILTETKISNTIFSGKTETPSANNNEEYNVIWDITTPMD